MISFTIVRDVPMLMNLLVSFWQWNCQDLASEDLYVDLLLLHTFLFLSLCVPFFWLGFYSHLFLPAFFSLCWSSSVSLTTVVLLRELFWPIKRYFFPVSIRGKKWIDLSSLTVTSKGPNFKGKWIWLLFQQMKGRCIITYNCSCSLSSVNGWPYYPWILLEVDILNRHIVEHIRKPCKHDLMLLV